ncbi:MAG: hypothetical protein GXN99_02295 [Candidatus Nanohaloarchaeota archaeon]|nr:hypothetical protein [Candidatus Nanohaloarchaeota archaeon]
MGFNPRAMAFFILALASLGIAGFMFKNGDSLSKDISLDFNLPTGWFVSKEKSYVKADIYINGTFKETIPIKVEEQNIVLAVPAESTIYLNNMWEAYVQPAVIEIAKYKGKVYLMPYKIGLIGETLKLSDSLHIIKRDSYFDIQYNGTYDKFLVKEVPSQTIIIPSYLGKIELHIKGDKVIYEVSNKDVEIKEFEGYIKVINGKIEIKGSGLLRSDVLEVYAEE